MLLASTGARATEALSIRNGDLNLELIPPKITIRVNIPRPKLSVIYF